MIGTLSIVRAWDEENAGGFDYDLSFLKMVGNLVGQTVRLHRMLSAERKRFLDEQRALEKALEQQLAETRGAASEGRRHRRRERGDPQGDGHDRGRREIQHDGAAARRERHRQGAVRPRDPRPSPRKAKAFIKLNCAALPESVLEFGALRPREGRLHRRRRPARRTLRARPRRHAAARRDWRDLGFFQAKLLRVLQEGEFERVGGNRTLKVDVRLICATNKNLEQAVAKGEFRADLYYRINVIPIFLPPLRDRPGDIALLARAFVDRFNAENGRSSRSPRAAWTCSSAARSRATCASSRTACAARRR